MGLSTAMSHSYPPSRVLEKEQDLSRAKSPSYLPPGVLEKEQEKEDVWHILREIRNKVDEAVDDTDLPAELKKIQTILRNERADRVFNKKLILQDLLPFFYSPLVRPLTISDLESCVALENVAFQNPAHCCSREKFAYRLTKCPELCMGVFCTVVPSKTRRWTIETLRTANPVEGGREDGAVSVLLAHIVATRSHDQVVTDEAMDYPRDYKVAKNQNSGSSGGGDGPRVGHQEAGRTLCIHSLAVHPNAQCLGLGKLLLTSYMRRAEDAALADNIALICTEYLVSYYKRFGFTHRGPSNAAFGGGGWHDMVTKPHRVAFPPTDNQLVVEYANRISTQLRNRLKNARPNPPRRRSVF